MTRVLSCLVAACLLLASPAAAQVGQWVDVTPPGVAAAFGGSNFGFSGHVLADPTDDAVFYAVAGLDGCYKSTDYGATWAKVSGTSVLSEGNAWAAAIAPDASYILVAIDGTAATNGNNLRVHRSTDGCQTFTSSAGLAGSDEPYGFDISRQDPLHAILSTHNDGDLWESSDGGQTWTHRGAMGTGQSPYAYFGLTDAVIIATSDGDDGAGNGTRRGVWNGTSWDWTVVSDQQHWHGSHQLWIDHDAGVIYNPGARGIDRSTDNGANWTRVETQTAASLIGTATVLYAMRSYALSGGTFSPELQHAARSDGTTWIDDTDPVGMDIGARSMAVQCDGTNYVIVTTNWVSGLWRYVEPDTSCSNDDPLPRSRLRAIASVIPAPFAPRWSPA